MAAVAAGRAFHLGLVLTAFGFGFRHGIDWDHIAALTDITSSQRQPRRSMGFATLYALGHALVVFALGFGAIVLAARLPHGIDATMERVVGATLIGLGGYVFYSLATQGREFRMRSRWMLVFAGVRRARDWTRARVRRRRAVEMAPGRGPAVAPVPGHSLDGDRDPHLVAVPAGGGEHRHAHRHRGIRRDDLFVDYAPKTAFAVGMLHGVGAETPTQLLIFLTAAGAGGKGAGLLLLGCFLLGLLTSNTVVATAGTLGFLGAAGNFKLYVTVSSLTAAFSLAIGLVFLFGSAAALPALFGG